MRKTSIVTIALASAGVFGTTAAAQQPLEYKVTVAAEAVKGAANDYFVTLSGPVHLPDVTLAAGTYVFKLLDSSMIQVGSTDRSEVYTMFFTTPVQRRGTEEDYEVTLVARGATAPPRVKEMFLGRTLGFEPVYDNTEARGDR